MAKLYIGSKEVKKVYIGSTLIDLSGGISLTMTGSPTTLWGSPLSPGGTFGGMTFLKSVKLPNTITSIGMYAFDSCKNLESVTLPTNLTTIGTGAFIRCINLNNVVIPSKVTTIEMFAFQMVETRNDVFKVTFNTTSSLTLSGESTFSSANMEFHFTGDPPTIPSNSSAFFATNTFVIYYKASNTKWTSSVKTAFQNANNYMGRTPGCTITWKTE